MHLKKYITTILFWLSVISSVNGEVKKIKGVIEVYGADETFYSYCSKFYPLLRSPKQGHIEFVSKTVVGVPEGKYFVSDTDKVQYEICEQPTYFLVKNFQSPDTKQVGYLVCVITPYYEMESLEIGETREVGWLEGSRRYDFWHYDKTWKVVLGVDPFDENKEYWFEGNETTFYDSLSEASKVLKDRLDYEMRVEAFGYRMLDEHTKKKHYTDGARK